MNIDIKGIKFLPILLAGIISLNACNDSNEIDGGDPPVMPPASSLSPDLNYFNEGGDESGRFNVVSNWVYAATNVTVYSAILGTALTVPVTAYKIALEQDATFDSDLGGWIWSYDVNVGSAGIFGVRLTAEISGEEVMWTGHISKEGLFEDFVWFEGTSAVGGGSGSWTLYESYSDPTPWLSAVWEKSDVEGKANVTFTVDKTGDNEGSSISYNATSSENFNRGVIIDDTNSDNIITVDWHSTDKNGRVKSPAQFQDDAFHCWDGQLQDVDC